jgi:hypothetical protein
MKWKFRPRCNPPEINANKSHQQKSPKVTMSNNPEMPLQPNKHQKHPKSAICVDVMSSTCGILRSEVIADHNRNHNVRW